MKTVCIVGALAVSLFGIAALPSPAAAQSGAGSIRPRLIDEPGMPAPAMHRVSAGEWKEFPMPLEEGRRVVVGAVARDATAALGVFVLDPGGEPIDEDESHGRASFCGFAVPADGTYTVIVGNVGETDAEFTFEASVDERMADAGAFRLAAGEEKEIEVELEAGRLALFGLASLRDVDLCLHGPDGEEVEWAFGLDGTPFLSFIPAEAGRYTLYVINASDEAVTATLRRG